MRLDPKLVHPSIFKATDTLAWSGRLYGGGTAKDLQASNAHQKVWMSEYGKGCIAYSTTAFAGLIGTVALAHNLDKPGRGLVVFAYIGVMLALGFWAYMRNLRQISSAELAALLPMMDLTEAQRTYAETLIALDRSGRSKTEIDDAMRALNSLLDEDARLAEMREQLSGSPENGDRQTLIDERAKLVARAESAKDVEAKRSFEQSIALLDERIAAFDSQGGQLERIDAHRELLRQALLATRDAARHAGTLAPTTDLATDSLRSAVALARAQSQETERALAELNAG